MTNTDVCGYHVDPPDRGRRRQIGFDEDKWEKAEEGYRCCRAALEQSGEGRCFWHAENSPTENEIRDHLDAPERIDGANFDGCVLDGTSELDLSGCGLYDASFDGVILENINFGRAEVDGQKVSASLINAEINADYISKANFSHAHLNDIIIKPDSPESVRLEEVNFGEAKLGDAKLRNLRIQQCSFKNSEISGADFGWTVFESVTSFATQKIDNSIFNNAEFQEIEFTGLEEMSGAKFKNTTMCRCIFEDIVINGSDFTESTIINSSFNKIECRSESDTETTFEDSTIVNTIFDDSEITSVSFDQSTLVAVEILGSDSEGSVSGASFEHCRLLNLQLSIQSLEQLALSDAAPALPKDDVPNVTALDAFEDWVRAFYQSGRAETLPITADDPVREIFAQLPEQRRETIETFSARLDHRLPLCRIYQDREEGIGGERREEAEQEIAKWPTILITSPSRETQIRDVDIQKATLHRARISNVTFYSCTFEDCSFFRSEFKQVEFRESKFVDTNLESVTGWDVGFPRTSFDDVSVSEETVFGTDDGIRSWRVFFWVHSPHSRKLNQEVEAMRADESSECWLNGPLTALKGLNGEGEEDVATTYNSVSRQYKALELLFSENNATRKAADYYFRCQDSRRKSARSSPNFFSYIWSTLKNLLYGYGVRPIRVVFSIGFVWLLFAVFYLYVPLEGDSNGDLDLAPTLTWPDQLPEMLIDRLYFSIITLTSVGFGDLYPTSGIGKLLAGSQGLIGMVLVVLLGYVLGNKEAW